MSVSKFLDPKNDFAFKQIFGTEKNQDILIHFINDILGFKGDEQVVTVEYQKTAQDPEIASQKQSLIDVLCKDHTGRQFIIEMQVAHMDGFEKRAQYYAARAYGRQLIAGDDYTALKEVIFIAITDFVMFKNKKDYYSTHIILDKETNEHYLKDFSFTFLELPKFKKKIEELETLLEKWAYFFKHAEETQEGDLERIVGGDTVIKRAYEALNRFSWSQVELNTYEEAEKRELDAKAILKSAKAEGEAIGEARGKAEGITLTLEAVKLIQAGASDQTIHEKLGIALDMIKALRQQIQSGG